MEAKSTPRADCPDTKPDRKIRFCHLESIWLRATAAFLTQDLTLHRAEPTGAGCTKEPELQAAPSSPSGKQGYT